MPPKIDFSEKIQLSTEQRKAFTALLSEMFPDYQQLLVEKEFDGNFSGSWVFLVHPLQPSELPVLVKIASVSLIQREWEAYEDNIRGKWPYVAPIKGTPVSDGTFSGLCYLLVGEGVFQVESLQRYSLSEATTVKNIQTLFSRLGRVFERALRFRRRIPRCRLWGSYEPLLPFNLLIKPVSQVVGKLTVITPLALPTFVEPNSYVELKDFVVAKVNLRKYNMTLNLPREVDADRLPNNSYYVCLQFETAHEMPTYKVGETIPLIQAQVVKTRDCYWQEEMEKVRPDFQLGMPSISLSDGTTLPNPLGALKKIRSQYYDIEVDYIHGDMNLENILVDPQVGDVRLIDFGLARWDHVLHDFLRLETEVVTKLVTPALVQAGLSAETIIDFYQQLHCATFHSPLYDSAPPLHSALEKAFTILRTVRNMACEHGLLNRNKVAEYYDGLTLYLLGTLKFENLNRKPDDPKPWPKEVAFWGAATVQQLLQAPPACDEIAPDTTAQKLPLSVQSWQYYAGDIVPAVSISDDGRMLFASCLGKTLLCLTEAGKPRWQRKVGNQAWRTSLSADGQTIVVGTGSTRPWDRRKRGLFCFSKDGLLRWYKDLKASVWGLSISADGSTIAVGTDSKQLLLFDGSGNRFWARELSGSWWHGWVWSTALSADGQLVIVGGADKRIELLDRQGKLLATHQARADVFTVAASADGTVAAAGDREGFIYLFDQHGDLLWEKRLPDKVSRVKLRHDGKQLFVGTAEKEKEGHITVYDQTGQVLWQRFVEAGVSCLDVSRDGQRIAVGAYGGAICIFDGVGKLRNRAQAQKEIRDIAISASGETIIAGSEDCFVYGFIVPR